MARLTVCADDFALSGGVSHTIHELALAGKINAISCMAISPRWLEDARLLTQLPPRVKIGLHIVLSDGIPLTPMPLLAPNGHLPSANALAHRARMGGVPKGEIAAEIEAQFQRFKDVVGRPADFVDGHQHIHILRGVRDIVLAQAARQAPRAWIRTCEDRFARIIHRPFCLKGLVNALQSRGLRAAARTLGLRTNDGFAGLYDFQAPFEPLFDGFLAKPGSSHLVICHPGNGDIIDDVIGEARIREATALRSLSVRGLAEAQGLVFD
jgi:predicted glycoside hydrolase/deacetylase ChbG (UPF0249 family)